MFLLGVFLDMVLWFMFIFVIVRSGGLCSGGIIVWVLVLVVSMVIFIFDWFIVLVMIVKVFVFFGFMMIL